MGNFEVKRLIGRPRRRWEDKKIELKAIGCKGVDWIDLAHASDNWRALVSAVMTLRFPYSAGNFFTKCRVITFSRRALLHSFIYIQNN